VDIDPRVNVVVFRLRRGKDLVERVPALAEDGVRQAWDAVVRGQKARAKQVVGLHTEWAPSSDDAAFIAATFPGVTVGHRFVRPSADGWDEAFAAASAVLQAELRPVLWSSSSGRAGQLADVPHWPVAAGRLHLALAVVTPTATYHVTHEQFGGEPFDEVMATVCRGLVDGLDISARDDGVFAASGRVVAALACLPDFYQRLSRAVGAERLVVGLPSPDDVLVAGAGSPSAEVVERAVLESAAPGGELVPCVLAIEGDQISVLAERTPADPA
jgi:hypothetical protein